MRERIMLRRTFFQTALAATATAQTANEWGSPVLGIHLHPRRQGGSAVEHMDGAGVRNAVLLARVADVSKVKAEMAANPGRLAWFAAADPTQPDALTQLRKAVEAGAIGFGEMKNHVAADSAEMRRVYDLAAELRVPVLIHFQEVEHFAGEGDWNTGYRQMDRLLQAHRKTTFIGHADFFWANISADEPSKIAYPATKVKRGGLTDRWLGDHENLYGDLSANSGYNALTRDAEFTRGFLERHRRKLMFGCDCSCRDGRGTGGSPILPQLKGKCVARATLAVLKESASGEVFGDVVWGNGNRLLRV